MDAWMELQKSSYMPEKRPIQQFVEEADRLRRLSDAVAAALNRQPNSDTYHSRAEGGAQNLGPEIFVPRRQIQMLTSSQIPSGGEQFTCDFSEERSSEIGFSLLENGMGEEKGNGGGGDGLRGVAEGLVDWNRRMLSGEKEQGMVEGGGCGGEGGSEREEAEGLQEVREIGVGALSLLERMVAQTDFLAQQVERNLMEPSTPGTALLRKVEEAGMVSEADALARTIVDKLQVFRAKLSSMASSAGALQTDRREGLRAFKEAGKGADAVGTLQSENGGSDSAKESNLFSLVPLMGLQWPAMDSGSEGASTCEDGGTIMQSDASNLVTTKSQDIPLWCIPETVRLSPKFMDHTDHFDFAFPSPKLPMPSPSNWAHRLLTMSDQEPSVDDKILKEQSEHSAALPASTAVSGTIAATPSQPCQNAATAAMSLAEYPRISIPSMALSIAAEYLAGMAWERGPNSPAVPQTSLSPDVVTTTGWTSTEASGEESPEPVSSGSAALKRQRTKHLEEDVPGDTWNWRKYGQKVIKDSNLYRSYYRCGNRKTEVCNAKRHVDRYLVDNTVASVVYDGDHSHSMPPKRVRKTVVIRNHPGSSLL